MTHIPTPEQFARLYMDGRPWFRMYLAADVAAHNVRELVDALNADGDFATALSAVTQNPSQENADRYWTAAHNAAQPFSKEARNKCKRRREQSVHRTQIINP